MKKYGFEKKIEKIEFFSLEDLRVCVFFFFFFFGYERKKNQKISTKRKAEKRGFFK